MKPTRVQEVIQNVIGTNWPLFIWGPPGVGKSTIVQNIAKKNELDLIDIRASLLDPHRSSWHSNGGQRPGQMVPPHIPSSRAQLQRHTLF